MARRCTLSIALFSALLILGCAARTAQVTDQSELSTNLSHLKLLEGPVLKILMGGAVREIPLKDIFMLEIDPSESIVVEREIYFAGHLRLREGTILHPVKPKANSQPIQCYVGIRNTLQGRRLNETYKIPIEKVLEIKFDK
jgi:hypothetical protein